ncbi:hypothetical protein CH260_04750 [Rhodococcus sp. 05-2256-B2]|jgi:hypothetical protein|uniref:DUF3618 domain-containing protein n=1 Tax=Rhodococcus navarretei TaxID=3128981 RepID=A0ABU9D0V2_9NOCA|nr:MULTISPECIES: DUF3618 domain-containing protein [unclassified Rhodococcus (in: high G+C Gram-positive bacteria)]OZE02785.1 hypothetical protein CH285_12475 [Rhodococcus sp. 05-2256-B1]OZD85367.1 hypothetical protein CH258_14270 [Rhodococcus sp. 05-2256-B4]OZD99260.1 hypothetical protein CH257_00360 [Rhodococcus sp. 05-2256-B3]OZE00638.1 hypothetical protein CH260_04750 [Rhodococcus sp. 05-2256-B2]RMB70260.1 DUF3618 domain-containing protein [Rhodococcus sp. SBT000017]
MTENKHVARGNETGEEAHVTDPPVAPVPDIEQQRAELAETVAALADKVDVPARVRSEATVQAEKAKTLAQDNPQVAAAAVGTLVAAVVLVVFSRRRRARRLLR